MEVEKLKFINKDNDFMFIEYDEYVYDFVSKGFKRLKKIRVFKKAYNKIIRKIYISYDK